MRITTNSMVRNYNSSLGASLEVLNKSRERVYSRRNFLHTYEDPAGATRAAQLNRQYTRIDDYLNTIGTVQGRQDSAEGTLRQIVSMTGSVSADETLQAINGTSDESTRATYAESLRQFQHSLLQYSNSQFEGEYVFAGADGANPAFTRDDAGNIYYRDINVSTGAPKVPGTHSEAEGLDQLSKLCKEKIYVDVGLGVNTANSAPANSTSDFDGSTAFDMSINGIDMFGFGQIAGSESGGKPAISKNLITLVGQMADELDDPNFDISRFSQMRDQLKENFEQLTNVEANMGVKTKFLESTKERLKDDQMSVYQQLSAIEEAEPAGAIMDYSYSQYAYNMVLKVGTSLLTNSFIDFMK